MKTEKELLKILDKEIRERDSWEQLILFYGDYVSQEIKDEYLKKFITVHVLKYILELQ